MALHPLVGFLLCSLVLPARARFLLVAHFHTYENTLHAYRDTAAASGGRCCSASDMSPPNCTDPCATRLQYCFKEYGTNNSFSDDHNITGDCLGTDGRSRSLMDNTDYIDYSSPPLNEFGRTIPTMFSPIGVETNSWPGRIQFFVRAAAGDEVVDYLYLDFSLSPGEALDNQTLSGHHFGSEVTFTVSFTLTCRADFYGPNCSVYCRPVDSDELGHYSCLSDGRIQCLEGYRNETSNCTECVPAEGCQHGSCDSPGECRCAAGYRGELCEEDLDVCGHTSPCQRWEVCNNTGPDSHQCSCRDGYGGMNCTEPSRVSPHSTHTVMMHTPPPHTDDGSAVAIAVGVSVGCLVVLIATVLVGVVVLAALQRRRKSHNVNFEDKVRDEKPYNIYSRVQAPGSNPVYDDENLGEHLPLGKSATAAGGPEHQLDNPLYTMEPQTEVYYSSADQPPQHEYDYATSSSLPPATGPLAPPTSTPPHKYDYASLPPEEGELYDVPDMAPRPRPQQQELTYDYAEPPAGTVGSPTAVYDAPLLSDELETSSHDYDYADTPNVEGNTSHTTSHTTSHSTTPQGVPGQ